MMVDRKPGSLMSEINVTPFVDVMLVLLIIFMVTAPMMVQGVDVSLPETRKAERLKAKDEPLVVSINKAGQIHINDALVGVDNLGDKLKKIFENRATREVFLKADRQVPYGTVVQAMAAIKSAGVEHLGIVTEPPGKAGKPQKE